jgi:hypothetical protein
MDLIERYLAAIGRQLPAKQAADIKAELRDVLLSQVEEQQDWLGRPLDKSETEALLVDFGHPLEVAGRYRKTQHLIGPEVFPFWWASVRIMLLAVAGVYLALILAGVLAHMTSAEFNRRVPSVLIVAIYLFGLITLVFAAFERFGKTGLLRQWRPSRLPPAAGKRRSLFELCAEMTFDVVFIAWWLGAFRVRDVLPMPYPDFLRVSLAPVWMSWRGPIIAYFALEIVADLVAIARPAWIRVSAAVLAVRYLLGVLILSQILRADHWLVVEMSAAMSAALPTVQRNFDLGMRVGIGATIAAMLLRIALEAWRLRQAEQAMASERLSAA